MLENIISCFRIFLLHININFFSPPGELSLKQKNTLFFHLWQVSIYAVLTETVKGVSFFLLIALSSIVSGCEKLIILLRKKSQEFIQTSISQKIYYLIINY